MQNKSICTAQYQSKVPPPQSVNSITAAQDGISFQPGRLKQDRAIKLTVGTCVCAHESMPVFVCVCVCVCVCVAFQWTIVFWAESGVN